MKINKLNESMEHPYMFQYSCNNSTFGYDFQRYAQELGAKRMYDHTQKGGGLHFYTVPSEDVYNKLKEIAKKRFTVDMYSLRPYDKEKFANAKVQEAVNTHRLNEWDVSEPSGSEYGNFMTSVTADENDILSKYGIHRTKTRRYTSYDGKVNGHTFSYAEGHDGTTRWASSLIIDGREVDLFRSKVSAESFGTMSEKNSFGIQSLINMLNSDNLDGIVYREGKFMSIDEYSKSHAKLPDGTFAESMTIAYSEDTIKRMIFQLEKEIEDYKQLIIDEPEDKAYWEEEIKKCENEIADLQSYEPLKEARENEAWDDTETIHAAYDSYIEDCAWKQVDPISFEKFRNNYLGDKEESEEEFNSRIKYWAVLATDKDTGKEYYAGVYESERWAYYWAGMDRSADAEYGYGNFDYRVEQVSEYTEEMDKSKSELNDLKLRNYDNRNMTESVKRLGAGGRKLTEAKKGFLCKYKGCSIHDMGDVFVATNSTGLNIGQSKTKAGLEGIIDDYVANKSGVKSIEEATSSRGFYVTTYWPDEKWSPEEGGSMSYGWDANTSKFFRTEQEAQEYVDHILNGCEIISNYEGEYEYKDEDGDLMKIAIEPFHKRGKGHSPARSWVEAEFDVPAERPYFDRKGNRLARNPRLVAKEKRAAADLEKEFLAGIDSATTRKELIDFISDIKYSKLFVNNGEIIGDKWKSLKEASYGGYKYEYEVHWISPDGKDCLLGASRSIEGAAEIAMNQLDEIMDNPFETPERKSKFVNNLYIVKAGTEQDVTPINVEEYQSNLLFRLGVDTDNLVEDAQYDVKMMDLERVPSILNWDIADQLQDFFRENKLWVDELHYNQVQDRIEFDINWGDWKHEHMRAKWLLQELFEKLGIVAKINSYTTEEDGSDTYSAHYNVYAIKE